MLGVGANLCVLNRLTWRDDVPAKTDENGSSHSFVRDLNWKISGKVQKLTSLGGCGSGKLEESACGGEN